jgi:hypothetical protein
VALARGDVPGACWQLEGVGLADEPTPPLCEGLAARGAFIAAHAAHAQLDVEEPVVASR